MSVRITQANVRDMFDAYRSTAAELGYDVSAWEIKFILQPQIVRIYGHGGFCLPGFTGVGMGNYRDALNSIRAVWIAFDAIRRDHPQTSARPLLKYTVGGRYGTHYVDLYYDIDRDGTYKEQYKSIIAEGSEKKMRALAIQLNSALRTDPTQPIYSDPSKSYVKAATSPVGVVA